MTPPRSFLLMTAALLTGACATPPTGRRPQPPASPTVQAELGQREVIQAGEEYARSHGYTLAEGREATEVRPNYWRLRFGLAEEQGKLLHLEFDEGSGVVREEVIPVAPGLAPAAPNP
ncbi:hypothetical protein POL68_18810 [Stigmatella sp. ncwal1]|uniref:Peptidase propeptide and YPEB domain-containing protein n=1 Tax=Stigmatella ashevillensis TaxID=2995309 RepID=A0ABT5DA24_9BACT|nr:hypothetical protein [Stigmatella ashevillena]MDC0710535.1 hypothetical protein [Stigmatella ashevillena]